MIQENSAKMKFLTAAKIITCKRLWMSEEQKSCHFPQNPIFSLRKYSLPWCPQNFACRLGKRAYVQSLGQSGSENLVGRIKHLKRPKNSISSEESVHWQFCIHSLGQQEYLQEISDRLLRNLRLLLEEISQRASICHDFEQAYAEGQIGLLVDPTDQVSPKHFDVGSWI